MKKLLITTGGTGGHIFPAYALAQQVWKIYPHWEILFAGGKLSLNTFFKQAKLTCADISCSTLAGKNPFKLAYGGVKILKGCLQSKKLLQDFNPDLVIGFGSFYTFPILLTSKWLNIPFMLYESDCRPGKVNRFFAPKAHTVGVQFPLAASVLKGNARVAKLPLRENFSKTSANRAKSLSYYSLKPDLPTVLIFGGSQGARSINFYVKKLMESSGPLSFQVLHFTGNEETTQELRAFYSKIKLSASVKTFENQMDMAWGLADIAIGRSGASTIAEALEYEVPAILIPFPFSSQNHQEKNADFFCQVMGGGIKILEEELNSRKLYKAILEVLEKKQKYKEQMSSYKKNFQPVPLSQLVIEALH